MIFIFSNVLKIIIVYILVFSDADIVQELRHSHRRRFWYTGGNFVSIGPRLQSSVPDLEYFVDALTKYQEIVVNHSWKLFTILFKIGSYWSVENKTSKYFISIICTKKRNHLPNFCRLFFTEIFKFCQRLFKNLVAH